MKLWQMYPVLALTAALLAPAHAGDGRFLIRPGRSVGRTHLGPNGASALKRLPRPDGSSVGMSQQHLVWVSHSAHGGPQTLFIHTVANGVFDRVRPRNGVTIDLIRITSPVFHTRDGLHTGSTRAQILRRYPHARPEDNRTIYDAAAAGIAFEFDHGPRCTAIMVHPRGESHLADRQNVQGILHNGETAAP